MIEKPAPSIQGLHHVEIIAEKNILASIQIFSHPSGIISIIIIQLIIISLKREGRR
jgi:hypothetical protein